VLFQLPDLLALGEMLAMLKQSVIAVVYENKKPSCR